MRRNFNGAVVAFCLTALTVAPAFARGNDLVIKDGFGENVVIKHGFFGHNTEIVKDRLGDGFAQKNGWFGTKEQDVNVLGNNFSRKKGILGGSTVQGSTIFGDKIQTKKGIFGRRTTYVDVSGGASAIRGLWNANKSKLLGDNGGKSPLSGLGALGGNGGTPAPNGALETTPAPSNDFGTGGGAPSGN